MNKKLFTALALGIAVLGTGFATASEAEAGSRHGFRMHHGHHFGGHRFRGHKFRGWRHKHRWHRRHRHGHRWHKRHWYGYAGFYGYGAPNCRYYLNKYRWTGNYYWKKRYNKCVYRWY